VNRTQEFGAVSRGQTFSYRPEDLTIVTDPTHPLYDPSVNDPVPESLIKNVMMLGVVEPIVVRKNGMNDGKPVIEVMDGRTRVRAAKEANRRLLEVGAPPICVPAIYRPVDDLNAMTIMVSLNEQRKFEDHVTRAEKLQRYLNSGFSEEQAKNVFSLSSSQIKRCLLVLEMAPQIKQALRDKRITLDIAVRLTALPREKQVEALEALLELMPRPRGTEAKEMVDQKLREEGAIDETNETRPKSKSYKKVQKALEDVNCMPDSEFKQGIMQALKWIIGVEEPTWAQEEKRGPGRPRIHPVSTSKDPAIQPKRPGRPKGSKNKPKAPKPQEAVEKDEF
jgi:ParB family transcriptional regulator, chromosome partitioning protein